MMSWHASVLISRPKLPISLLVRSCLVSLPEEIHLESFDNVGV